MFIFILTPFYSYCPYVIAHSTPMTRHFIMIMSRVYDLISIAERDLSSGSGSRVPCLHLIQNGKKLSTNMTWRLVLRPTYWSISYHLDDQPHGYIAQLI